jgi:hypothetical protein
MVNCCQCTVRDGAAGKRNFLTCSKEGVAMRCSACFLALLAYLSPNFASAAGTALTANFSVIAPNEVIAANIAQQAEIFRKGAALEWFGRDLPSGKGPVVVHFALSETEDKALSWCKDGPAQKFHRIWLTTSADKAIGSTLNHEVVHTVIATFMYPDFMPAWANEGISSQYDDAERKQAREQIAARWAKDGRWPQLQSLFVMAKIDHNDTEAYAVAASVTRFLASTGGKLKVVEFAKGGLHGNWDQTAHDAYGVCDVQELQARWQSWVRQDLGQNNGNTAALSQTVHPAVN